MLIVSYGLDILFVLDIYISMKRVTVLSSTICGFLIHNIQNLFSLFLAISPKSKVVACRYVTSRYFYLDLFAVLPFELLSLIWLSHHNVWKYFSLFRLNRLLKFWKVYKVGIKKY